MLMVSDLRHDLERLKARTFPNEGSSSVAESRVESTPTVSIKFSQLVCMCRIIHSLDVWTKYIFSPNTVILGSSLE